MSELYNFRKQPQSKTYKLAATIQSLTHSVKLRILPTEADSSVCEFSCSGTSASSSITTSTFLAGRGDSPEDLRLSSSDKEQTQREINFLFVFPTKNKEKLNHVLPQQPTFNIFSKSIMLVQTGKFLIVRACLISCPRHAYTCNILSKTKCKLQNQHCSDNLAEFKTPKYGDSSSGVSFNV